MLTKNELFGRIFWPTHAKGLSVLLLDQQGDEILASYKSDKPVRGDELARMIPDGHQCAVENAYGVNLTGPLRVTTVGVFDTKVVTERAPIDLEARMSRLENKAVQSERRNLRLAKLLKEEQEKNEKLVEDDPRDVPDPAGSVAGDAEPDAAVGEEASPDAKE